MDRIYNPSFSQNNGSNKLEFYIALDGKGLPMKRSSFLGLIAKKENVI